MELPGRLAVLGSPIAHSQSPAMHRAAYAALGLDWAYDAIEVPRDADRFLAGLGAEWRGLSLTMPLKTEAPALIDDLDPLAQHTGAVNTVLLQQRRGGPHAVRVQHGCRRAGSRPRRGRSDAWHATSSCSAPAPRHPLP